MQHIEQTWAILEAFQRAERAGLSQFECYRAAAQMWGRCHPGTPAREAASRAAALVRHARIDRTAESRRIPIPPTGGSPYSAAIA